MSKKRYSEFRREAVRLVTDQGYSNLRAGKAVGVCHTAIRTWVAKYAPDRSVVGNEFDSAEEELRGLRAENSRRMERDPLNRAAEYFAGEDRP